MKRRPLARKGRSGAKKATPFSPTSSTTPTDLLIDLGRAGIQVPVNIDDKSVEAIRDIIRRVLIKNHTHKTPAGVRYHCAWCGEVVDFLDMHEIVNRNRTQMGSLTRLISYMKEMVVMLCRECHEMAHGPAQRDILFQLNYTRYGEERVRLVYDLLLRSTISGYIEGVRLP